MKQFYTRHGPHLMTHGTCDAAGDVFLLPGWEVVLEPPPAEATNAPPVPGALWNLDTEQWDAPVVTEAEHWARVRYERDLRLAATDWAVLRAADQGEPVSPEWLAYRQALRDVTAQADPLNIAWPVAPAA